MTTTDTTSMRYNSFNQRSWNANVSSKRDIAINGLKEELTTKYAELTWSSGTSVNLVINENPAVPDTPAGDETGSKNSRPFKLVNIRPAQDPQGVWTKGYATVHTPPGISPYFDLIIDTATLHDTAAVAGNECIRYIHSSPQLCEIEGMIDVTSQSVEEPHTVFLSVFVNSTATNTLAGDKLPETFARSAAITDNTGADQITITLVFKHVMILNKNDKVKLVVWKNDVKDNKPIGASAARLSIKTLP